MGCKKQEGEERCGGMCPGCDGGEDIISSIKIFSKEIYEFLFACISMLERGG